MKPGPTAAVQLVPRYLELDAPPTAAVTVLRQIIVGEGWERNEDLAYELAESWVGRFLLRCGRLVSERNGSGQFCEFTLNSSSPDLLQGASFVEGIDPPEVAEAKTRRLAHGDYRAALDGLSPSEFEWACRGMLAAMGVRDPVVSRRSADEGIDFYGQLPLSDELRRAVALPGFYSTLSVWLVGQAKHYRATQVATPDIRELVGSVELARARAFASSASLPDLRMRLCDPVFYLFFTTGKISADGWALMRASGVVGMDGPMVAAFLADHDIGCSTGTFELSLFQAWVQQYGREWGEGAAPAAS